MDKQAFMDKVFSSISTIPVSEVISKRIRLDKKRHRHVYGLCPFHSDTSVGSFVVTDDKRMWECFTCRIGGNAAKFISLYDNIDYVEAAVRIAYEFGQISQNEYRDYMNDPGYSVKKVVDIEKQYTIKTKPDNQIATPELLDQVYTLFSKHAGISNNHVDYLLNHRGISNEDIVSGGYFTFPTRRILREFMADIRNQFGTEDILGSVPGFYYDKTVRRFTFAKYFGLGIPIHNTAGYIVGIQVRKDSVSDTGMRYVWFSSSFVTDSKYSDEFDKGTSSGAPPDVHFPKKLLSTNVYITEGHFKAKKISDEFGSIAVSVQGIGSQKGIITILNQLPMCVIEHSLSAEFQIGYIYLAFDADVSFNIRVFEQLKQLSDNLLLHNYVNYYVYWPFALGKGIDDVITNGHKDSINLFEKYEWDHAYMTMEEELRDYVNSNIYKVPQEIIGQFFSDIVLSMITPLDMNEPELLPSLDDSKERYSLSINTNSSLDSKLPQEATINKNSKSLTGFSLGLKSIYSLLQYVLNRIVTVTHEKWRNIRW